MNDGSVLGEHCRASRGTPDNRLTRSEIEHKFPKGAAGRLAAATTAGRFIETVEG